MDEFSDYINLIPGNWFDLKKYNLEKSEPYNLDRLECEIEDHIIRRTEKLEHIELKYNYNIKTIFDIEFRIDDLKFNKMIELMKTDNNKMLYVLVNLLFMGKVK